MSPKTYITLLPSDKEPTWARGLLLGRTLGRSWTYLLLGYLLSVQALFSQVKNRPQSSKDQSLSLPFMQGEMLRFNFYIGPVRVGLGGLQLRSQGVSHLGKDYVHMRAFGRTTGLWRMLYKIDDVWGGYYNTREGYPIYFYRFLRENNYKKYETTHFYYNRNIAEVRTYEDSNLQVLKEKKNYTISSHVYDVVSIYYALRTFRLDTLFFGEIFEVPIFFEDTLYDVKVRYLGTGALEIEMGAFEAYVFSPIFPENSLFRGENPVKIWISKDKNRLLLRIKADMRVGSARIDLVATKNLRYTLHQK